AAEAAWRDRGRRAPWIGPRVHVFTCAVPAGSYRTGRGNSVVGAGDAASGDHQPQRTQPPPKRIQPQPERLERHDAEEGRVAAAAEDDRRGTARAPDLVAHVTDL